ncbi:uncharacterized protein Z518_01827 [Rhinocladiella mackenziei CBS 650.93]|uniref:Uncharacterized protein n=1 Tax=Rhinocladiella mackenziei CBS 650.93 TaxID=1442369 RepID=A0A0D2IMZ4_9EURO|nr:uncharacterized protein Z518_01827 [Rhinocladiella mackenziei CBS 650.93]KIX07174.1 hypothetical protein Z518_01827 [Rhinocladiella mackenziei CBS 650.93]
MAEVNGISKHEDTVSVSTTHLGKRKRRTVSPDPSISPSNLATSPLQAALQDVLRLLRKHDPTPSLLKYPLSSTSVDTPDAKRARLSRREPGSETIEDRITSGNYASFQALKEDVNSVKVAILDSLSDLSVNAKSRSSTLSESEAQEKLSKLVNVLETYDVGASKTLETGGADACEENLAKASTADLPSGEVLSLRSQVNGNPSVIFSGLQTSERLENDGDDAAPDSDEPGLPNGFEFMTFAPVEGEHPNQKQEKRTFEKVFPPPSRSKPLEFPRPARDQARSSVLQYGPQSTRTESNPRNKHDYKYERLPTGLWLTYGVAGIHSDQDRWRTHHGSGVSDFKTALGVNGVPTKNPFNEEAAFTSAYSSFAPTSDNSHSLVSDEERSRLWLHKYGEQKLSQIFRTKKSEDTDPEATDEPNDEDFADAVAHWEPTKLEDVYEDIFGPKQEDKDVDHLLAEVSEMIATLSAYKMNRDLPPLDKRPVTEPSSAEMEVFEMLRAQLSVLVSTLPPFAVAKLNGDQLEKLNISTKILVEAPDYPGTGQVDDYTLQRQRMAQQATSAASRTATTPQVRPGYGQSPATYSSQVRGYNSSVPATAAYGMRTSNYQTPTASRPSYSQTPYQPPNNLYGSRPSVQQFQRPTQNGYGNYGGTPAQTQTPSFAQRPSQPGYQQRAQDTAVANAGRSVSPQKPLVNGQTYSPRPYQTQQAQTPYAYQRQGSGTPATPIASAATPVGSGYGRDEGNRIQAGTEKSSSAALTQTQSAQTVEVSR